MAPGIDEASPVPDETLLPELARWLGAIPPDARERVAGWSDGTWERFRQHVRMQGLAAVLADHLRAPGAESIVPPSLQAWLDDQELQNALRVERMRGELGAILRETAARGIEVMPLKGAYLLEVPAADPRRRPMADLDLLVRPAQRAGLRAVLRGLGYAPDRRARVDLRPQPFYGPGRRAVATRDGEHPDNPRPVEVHVAIHRHSWEWLDRDTLTEVAWASATPGTLVGEPVLLPPIGLVLEHLAVHATIGLMRGRGRLIQWLDLARLGADGAAPATWHLPHLAYPSLQLAARVLPDLASKVDLDGLAGASSRVAVEWARTVPLDRSAGLQAGRPTFPPRNRDGTAERWRPSRLRLGVAYGPMPVPAALGRHVLATGRHAVRFARSRAGHRIRRSRRRFRHWRRRVLRRTRHDPG